MKKEFLSTTGLFFVFCFCFSQNVYVTHGFHGTYSGLTASQSLDTSTLHAYDVIAASGNSDSLTDGSAFINWTVGETVISTAYNPVGIESITQLAELKVYPNPTRDKVIVEIRMKDNTPADLLIALFNLEGKNLYFKKIMVPGYKGEIDLASSPDGQYVLAISKQDGTVIETYSIEKIH